MEPSEIPALPPEQKIRKWVVMVAITLLTGSVVTAGCLWYQQHHQQQAQLSSLSDMRQLGLALMDFNSKYGSLPSADTLESVNHAASRPLSAAASGKNPLLQLETAGITTHVEDFLAAPRGAVGDWLYFPGASTTGNSGDILMVAPSIDGSRIAMRLDNSATSLTPQQIEEAIWTANPPPVAIRPTKYLH
ncbi:MAG: hypothetical protein QM755_16170 [Luteolibacter sp.]